MESSRPLRFHVGLTLFSGLYLYVALWLKLLGFTLFANYVGQHTFSRWQQLWGLYQFRAFGTWVRVYTSFIDYVEWCLLSIPLYFLWSILWRNTGESYLRAMTPNSDRDYDGSENV